MGAAWSILVGFLAWVGVLFIVFFTIGAVIDRRRRRNRLDK